LADWVCSCSPGKKRKKRIKITGFEIKRRACLLNLPGFSVPSTQLVRSPLGCTGPYMICKVLARASTKSVRFLSTRRAHLLKLPKTFDTIPTIDNRHFFVEYLLI
jgi:hypothetical protein